MAKFPAWADQARVMGKRIRRLCEKRGPVAPLARVMFGDKRATPAVLKFLRDTRMGRTASLSPRDEGWWGEEEDGEGEEGSRSCRSGTRGHGHVKSV